MDEKEKSTRGIEKEIFETCKKENRKPNISEILILSNFDEQKFFKQMCPGVEEMIQEYKEHYRKIY